MDHELLDRYLHAVRFWLPSDRKQDIIAELSEDLRSGIEDKEAELGRRLTGGELEDILTRWGHPMTVAGRYLPQRYLIGPLLFPAYRLVLRIVGLVYLLPWLLVAIGFAVFDPSRRSADSIAGTFTSFWLLVLHVLVVVTAVFAVIERRQAQTKTWDTWTAGTLGKGRPAGDLSQIPRTHSVAELVSGLIFIWWSIGLLGASTTYEVGGAIRITLWALTPAYYWSFLSFLVAGAAIAAVNLVRPWWTRRRAGAQLAVDAFGLVLVCLLLLAGPVIEIIDPNARPGLLGFAKWGNLSWYVTLAIIAVGCLARSIQAARRAFGWKPSGNWAIGFLAGS